MSLLNTLQETLKKGGVALPAVGKKHHGALGIDIGTSSIKVVQIHNNEGVVTLDTYGEIALGPLAGSEVGQSTNLPPEKISEALTDVVEASQVQAVQGGVCVPFASSLVKLIEIPPLDEKKLATVIPIEARKYVPVPIDQVRLDYFIVPETEQRLFEANSGQGIADDTPLRRKLVLIVAIHDETLQRLTGILKNTALQPEFFELEVFSAVRSTVPRGLAPVAILDVGAATTKMYLVELGIVLGTHVVSMGSQDITRSLAKSLRMPMGKAEELKRSVGLVRGAQDDVADKAVHIAELTMEHIFAESKRVLVEFERRYNKVVTKGVLVGGGAALKGIQAFAQDRLDMEVAVGQPFEHVDTPAFLADTMAEVGPVFAGAAGAAMRALKEG